MSTMSLRLPESLHNKLRELADREGVSMNQLATLAITEKISALLTVDYLEERARRGSRERFLAILGKTPPNAPIAGDELEGD